MFKKILFVLFSIAVICSGNNVLAEQENDPQPNQAQTSEGADQPELTQEQMVGLMQNPDFIAFMNYLQRAQASQCCNPEDPMMKFKDVVGPTAKTIATAATFVAGLIFAGFAAKWGPTAIDPKEGNPRAIILCKDKENKDQEGTDALRMVFKVFLLAAFPIALASTTSLIIKGINFAAKFHKVSDLARSAKLFEKAISLSSINDEQVIKLAKKIGLGQAKAIGMQRYSEVEQKLRDLEVITRSAGSQDQAVVKAEYESCVNELKTIETRLNMIESLEMQIQG